MIGMVTNVAMIEIMLNVMASEDIKSADVVMLIVSKWNARFVVMRELQKEKMRSGFMKEICDLIGNQNVQTSMEDWNARSCQKFSARLLYYIQA
ncbi:putative dehydratase YbiW [Trichinella spiralis]|uniref:Dehydratase YbiW n=1 Tax=Trichinella spiralis TaxID=6334 RepID=A0ABR3KLM1_TRISP